ncbi:MAG: helix-turn-helix domain-containing protein [Planctomycetota bacterium]|nr:helix-turn-helix domain-containing protein [Planctomycetota bacterium]
MTVTEPARAELGPSGALTHGLEVLRILAESEAPMTSTEIARRVGLHQSSVSRVLKTLMAAGYVRKPDYHSFAADYGLLALGGRATSHFAAATRPRRAIAVFAERCEGLTVSFATLWRGQLIYLVRAQRGQETIGPWSGGYPLHLSSLALRILLEAPAAEAREALAESRRKYGWDQPTARVPGSEAACLSAARERLRHDVLVLDDWQAFGRLTAAIPVAAEGQPPLALSLSGNVSHVPIETVLLLLQEGRREVERAMREPG